MNNKTTVLIVEDEAEASDFISSFLKENGYKAIVAANGATAVSMFSSYCPDVVLLDLSLPDMDGFSVLKTLRQWSEVPAIILSACFDEAVKVRAFDSGADDYMVKPVGRQELLARIRAAIRHSIKMETGENVPEGRLVRGGLVVDFEKHAVLVDGSDVHLTQNEFRIVSLIAKHSGQVLTYSYLLEQIWGHFAECDRQILRVNMANIRRKIENDPSQPKYIVTEVGVGYQMVEEPGGTSA